jgi:predicted ATPase
MLRRRTVSYRSRVAVSEALRSAMLGRLRSLARNERAILMRVSAIGRDFDFRIAVAAARCAEPTVRCALERARDLQILVALETDRYGFRHALTREIVYGELLSGQIRPLHRRIARTLEAAFESGEPVLEALAYHAWTGGFTQRGIRYNELAGDNAVAVHARKDARNYYSRARSLTEIDSSGYSRLTRKLYALDDVG